MVFKQDLHCFEETLRKDTNNEMRKWNKMIYHILDLADCLEELEWHHQYFSTPNAFQSLKSHLKDEKTKRIREIKEAHHGTC